MKYYLTQHYTIEHTELYDLTSPINREYAYLNGLEYVSSNIKRCPERKVWWEKIAWLMEFLSTIEDGSLVVYEDCDSLNVGGDIKDILHDGFEYGMIELRGGLGGNTLTGWFNAGVIVMINTKDVRAFLKRVWDRNDETDELSINKELKSRRWTIGNGKGIASLDVECNCWQNNSHIAGDVIIKSWHGMEYKTKLKSIKEYIINI